MNEKVRMCPAPAARAAAPLPVAVVGAGYFGAFHAARYAENPAAQLVAIVDPNPRARAVAERFDALWLRDIDELPKEVCAVSVATPPHAHASSGCRLLERGCDVLLEKPLAPTLAEADLLIATALRHDRILQVGHLERFNPAATVFDNVCGRVRYLECVRATPFQHRHAAIDVVLDLMIHDIDLALHWLGRLPRRIAAHGYSLTSGQLDFATARLEFADDVLVQLTASRFLPDRVSRVRALTDDGHYTIDWLKRRAYRRCARSRWTRCPPVRTAHIAGADPLALQIDAFLDAARWRRAPAVSGEQGRAALAVALDIVAAIGHS